MKRILIVFAVVGLAFLGFKPKENDLGTFPTVEVYDLDSLKISTEDLFKNNGNPVVIDFWATWCKPCLLSIKHIHENYESWQKETGVRIILISIEDNVPQIKRMAKLKGWNFEVYVDRGEKLKDALGLYQIPQTYIVAEDGKIKFHASEYIEEGDLYKQIKKAAK